MGEREPNTEHRGHGRGVSELRAAKSGFVSQIFSLLEVSSEDLYSVPEDGMKLSAELVTQHVRPN